jgi:hypothetical protein
MQGVILSAYSAFAFEPFLSPGMPAFAKWYEAYHWT